MHHDLPILESKVEGVVIPSPMGLPAKPQGDTFQFTVKDESKIYLNSKTDEWCLVEDKRLHPLSSMIFSLISLSSRDLWLRWQSDSLRGDGGLIPTGGALEVWLCDFGPKQFGWLINQLGEP